MPVSRETALIVQYTELLHTYRNPNHREVRKFRKSHSEDTVFQRRADTLDRVFRLKEEALRETRKKKS
ncbi:MAG: hypothetical protein HY566_03090 [Candidatus Kerfeldbacteria bacterium]|nr:hypothetical protein [Candidatus Kerfeldbacteria bacterium]